MKYDARACQFNMGTGCVELLLRDGRKISINCTGIEKRFGFSWFGAMEYLRNAAGSHGLED